MTFTTPQQPASAVIGRLLVSLGVLALGALAFRLSLRPVQASSDAAQTFTQRDALDGARRAQISLNGDVVNLNVSAADLPGLALRGQLSLPGTVSRQAGRTGDTLKLDYSERRRGNWTGTPWQLRLDADGLNVEDAPTSSVGRWDLKLSRTLPTTLDLKVISGDSGLNLAQSALSAFRFESQSGNLTARLPAALSGDVRLESLAGNLSARFQGTSEAAAGTFSSSTRSGEQQLDLGPSAFRSVRIETVSGDVRAILPQRGGVDTSLDSVSGDLDLSLKTRSVGGRLSVNTISGDLTLRLPAGLPVRVRLETLSGDLNAPGGASSDNHSYTSPAARAGGAALDITVQSVSGNVNIKEAQQ